MADFTSALYLGLRHPSATLGAWDALTLGRPAALHEPPGLAEAAAGLARLQGLQAATLLPSTLHLFWDLLRVLCRGARVALLLDGGAYPILRWAAQSMVAAGVALQSFPHHDPVALERLARRAVEGGRRPLVVCDGYCPACNRTAPLRAYACIATTRGGTLVVDDTQALGILGAAPSPACPYGCGGGGSLRWHALDPTGVVVGASLAKGYGAPLAVLSGSRALLERFRAGSETRLHASPPSVAAIRAAGNALAANAVRGEAWRERLLRRVLQLRAGLCSCGLEPIGALPFPVQSFVARHGASLAELHGRLRAGGVRALLTRACGEAAPRLTFVVTAAHSTAQVDRAIAVLAGAALPVHDPIAVAQEN